MALTPKYPRLVKKKANPTLRKAKMSGKTPKQGGHPIRGRGQRSSRGGHVGR